MRIIFFGSGAFGLPALQALHREHQLALVVTQPDRPAGRKRRLTPTPVAEWAARHNLPVIKPEDANTPQVIQTVQNARADAHIVIAFGQKVGPELIHAPRLGPVATMNLHASLLPRYRGAAPINWAIIRGEKETGNTLFALVEKMDAGDILAQQRTPIDPRETAGELHDRLAALAPPLVLDTLYKLQRSELTPQPQDESQKTLAPKLSKADAHVNFTEPAHRVRNRIHGLTPWPGVKTRYTLPDETGTPHDLLLRRVEVVENPPTTGEPGELIADAVIATGEAAVRLLEVQPPNKRTMTWQQFQTGQHLPPGTRFESG